ncbi:TIGR03086 family protein [Pseudonocardia thermophila]|uniref:TIGR03086 family protein n=1 Tax=Pseudonocardia thermophila TaxID=1848 RepID=A0A1M6V3L6_PSETH|nr:maleylpyruvate isomerase family mycothiol-dependent enzyme [Pseudonocardia thermophila]SHK75965.1 TIGR03086 family protein [Pseudonocardia thermophila]
MDDLLRLDACALAEIRRVVDGIRSAEWEQPTPCAGWSVRALVEHMTTEHVAICGGTRPEGDPVRAFGLAADRWLAFFTGRTDPVLVPSSQTEQSVRTVLTVHLADMVIHRWDLLTSLGREARVPEDLLVASEAVAVRATDPRSPLVGEGRAYRPALPADPGDDRIAALVRRYGRDPHWRPA